MIFWIFATVFIAFVLVMVLKPLLRSGPQDDTSITDNAAVYDVAVFKSQLREVGRDRARSRITQEEAESARIEIGRRLLAADKRVSAAQINASPMPSTADRVIAFFLIAGALAISMVLYDRLGNPSNPDMPLALRQAEIQLAQMAQDGARAEANAEADALALQATEMRARLEQDNGTAADWAALGRIEMRRGAFADAATAYERAIDITPDDPDLNSAYGEALVFWAGGEVTPTAYIAFQRVLTLRPGDPRARFYRGVYQRQEGFYRDALDTWTQLLIESGPDAPWAPILRERAESLAAEMGLDLEEALNLAAAAFQETQRLNPDALGALETTEGNAPVSPGPTAEDIAAARDMASEDQLTMIEGMVGRLADRLEETPDDLEGWRRLGRSYATLGRVEDALAALDRASRLAPDDLDLLISRARLIREIAGDVPTSDSVAIMRQVETLDPSNLEALWFLGIDAVRQGNSVAGRDYFDRALATLPKGSQEYLALSQELQRILPQE